MLGMACVQAFGTVKSYAGWVKKLKIMSRAVVLRNLNKFRSIITPSPFWILSNSVYTGMHLKRGMHVSIKHFEMCHTIFAVCIDVDIQA